MAAKKKVAQKKPESTDITEMSLPALKVLAWDYSQELQHRQANMQAIVAEIAKREKSNG